MFCHICEQPSLHMQCSLKYVVSLNISFTFTNWYCCMCDVTHNSRFILYYSHMWACCFLYDAPVTRMITSFLCLNMWVVCLTYASNSEINFSHYMFVSHSKHILLKYARNTILGFLTPCVRSHIQVVPPTYIKNSILFIIEEKFIAITKTYK